METLTESVKSFNGVMIALEPVGAGAIVIGTFILFQLLNVLLKKYHSGYAKFASVFFNILYYSFTALWTLSAVVTKQYDQLTVTFGLLLPAITRLVSQAYKRYDAWVDTIVSRSPRDRY